MLGYNGFLFGTSICIKGWLMKIISSCIWTAKFSKPMGFKFICHGRNSYLSTWLQLMFVFFVWLYLTESLCCKSFWNTVVILIFEVDVNLFLKLMLCGLHGNLQFHNGWRLVWSSLMHGLPMFSNIAVVVSCIRRHIFVCLLGIDFFLVVLPFINFP